MSAPHHRLSNNNNSPENTAGYSVFVYKLQSCCAVTGTGFAKASIWNTLEIFGKGIPHTLTGARLLWHS